MTLIVCPLAEVETLAAERGPSHVLSLLGPALNPPACPDIAPERRLHLLFNDIIEPAEGLILPNAEHIDELISFGRTWDRAAPMLVHCWAGISRSTAAAYILACDRAGPGREGLIAKRLREASAIATPNPLMIALADAALKRDGAMRAAIARIGRGDIAEIGKPFDLSLD
ncbi:MAG: protein tyrosine phosphatase [Hyphomicrobiales bacterium]